jgi:hypothetical protein
MQPRFAVDGGTVGRRFVDPLVGDRAAPQWRGVTARSPYTTSMYRVRTPARIPVATELRPFLRASLQNSISVANGLLGAADGRR